MKMIRQIPKLFLLVATLFVIGNSYSQTCPTDLVSYWRMDETSGLTLVDSKSSHNATCNIATDRITGAVRKAQFFNTSQYATVANHTDFAFGSTNFTIIYWFNSTYSSNDQVAISKGNYSGGSPTSAYFSSGLNGSGKVNFLISDGTNFPQLESSSSYNDGDWHQVACIKDGTNLYLFVDGTSVASTSISLGSLTNTNNILLGALLSNASVVLNFSGSLDEIAVYNRALAESEIDNQISNVLTMGIGICDSKAPEFASTEITKATLNKQYSYTAHAIGQQTTMVYDLITYPAGMAINASTGVITWTPTTKKVDGLVSVVAENGISPADTQSFRVYVSDPVAEPSGLICLHKLDETSGPTYVDYKVNHPATATVAPSATTGKIDGGQIFGSSTIVDIADYSNDFNWASSSSFSISVWVKTSTVGEMYAVSRFRTDAGAKWQVGTSPSGYARFELYDNSGDIANYITLDGTTFVADGAWHQIVAVRDGSLNKNIIYVDGANCGYTDKVYNNSFIADDELPLGLGYVKRLSGDPEYHFIGSIDEVAIFNVALSSTDISSAYNSGNPAGYCADGNFAPQFTSTPKTTGFEGETYTYNIVTEDIDASTVTIQSLNTPSWLSFYYTAGQKNATLTGIPAGANVGENSISLIVIDAENDTAFQSFTITVKNTNEAPVITSTPGNSAVEDAVYSYNMTVTDADAADQIDIFKASGPSWLTISHATGAKTAVISGTPDDADIGTNSFVIKVTDGYDTVPQSFDITVTSVNDAPEITGQSSLNVDEDQSITLYKSGLIINDPDNDTTDLTLIIQAGDDYTFSGTEVTPAENFNGVLFVNVRVSDPTDTSEVYEMSIIVNPVNDPPTITSTAISSAIVDELYSYKMEATDIDGDNIALSAEDFPAWLTFYAATGTLAGFPKASDIGVAQVTLRATDDATPPLYIEQTFTITVGYTGITEASANEFEIYPNPVSDVLNIRFASLADETMIDFINPAGILVQSVVIPAGSELTSISVKEMEAGIYICHIRNNTINSTSRFIVTK